MKAIFFYIFFLLPTLSLAQSQDVQERVVHADSSFAAIATTDTLENEHHQIFISLCLDTLVVVHSAYSSFADVFDLLPGSFSFNRGSVGQLALASLFAASASEVSMQYGELILLDPLTGLADLNMIPVQQIAHVRTPTRASEQVWGYQALGQTVDIVPREISKLPARSRITYRSGDYNYDDVDVMLGMRLSPKTDLNWGGLMKNYGGVTSHSDYKAQKIRGTLVRKIGNQAELLYSFLFNRFDLDEYLPLDGSSTTPAFRPHQKDLRYDHALTFSKQDSLSGLKVSLQHTRLYREFYDYKADLEELYKPDALRLTGEIQRHLRAFWIRSGGQGFANFVRSKNSDDFTLLQSCEWIGAGHQIRPNIDFEVQLRATQRSGFSPSLSPSTTLTYHPTQKLRFQLLALQSIHYPGPMELGYPAPVLSKTWDLRKMKSTSTTLFAEYDTPRLTVFTSAWFRHIEDRVVTSYNDTGIAFVNHPDETRWGFGGAVLYRPQDWIAFWLKGDYNIGSSQTENYRLLNLPQALAAGCVEVSGRFFKNDLLATLRFGGTFIGPRWGVPVWTGEYETEPVQLQAVVVPYARIFFIIDNVTLFVAMQNLLATEYEIIYGYPMPGREFRWGLTWNLSD